MGLGMRAQFNMETEKGRGCLGHAGGDANDSAAVGVGEGDANEPNSGRTEDPIPQGMRRTRLVSTAPSGRSCTRRLGILTSRRWKRERLLFWNEGGANSVADLAALARLTKDFREYCKRVVNQSALLAQLVESL